MEFMELQRILLMVLAIVKAAAWIPVHNTRKMTRLGWSQYAEVVCTEKEASSSSHSNLTIEIMKNPGMAVIGAMSYKMSSPREWLEFFECKNGEAAYTVLRCDYNLHKRKWTIWGQDYHLQRLSESYQILLRKSMDDSHMEVVSLPDLEQAANKSLKVLSRLLEEAEKMFSSKTQSNIEDFMYTVMTTLMWQPYESRITVRGHTYSTEIQSNPLQYNPDPIIASIAIDSSSTKKPFDLPNRYGSYPQAKLSSWCRRRRPLEVKFKVDGAGEVLLVQDRKKNGLHMLEGLTSNLFVVYPGGLIRTPNADSVLAGYARQVVLDCCSVQEKFQVEIGPIPLSDASIWEEVFLTSSVRLIYPVQQIQMVHYETDARRQYEVIWSLKQEKLIWKNIYKEVISKYLN